MIKLIWQAATIGALGPLQGSIPETTVFATKEECAVFGELMTPRIQDWVRGTLGADWHHPVRIAFKCEKNSEPV